MSDGDSLFTKKSSRSEAKDAGGDASADAKGAKMALNELEDASVDAKGGAASPAPPPPPRASVGWGSDAAEAAGEQKDGAGAEAKRVGRRRKGSDTSVAGAAGAAGGKAAKSRHFDDDSESADIVEIPDLEEEEREPDITTQIAEAPRNTTRAVQSLKELEKDIKFALPATTHGVDLQLLTSALCPEKAVGEPDEPWSFDSLLNDISQELQRDMDEKEEFLRAEAAAAAT